MGITDVAKRLRVRARRAWSAWRGEPASEGLEGPGQVQGENERRAEFKRQLGLTAEELDEEAKEEMLHKVQEDAEAEFEELNECMRGGNGDH